MVKTSNRKPRRTRKPRRGTRYRAASAYRPSVPRTLQIATKRNFNQTLKFTINQSYVIDMSKQTVGETVFTCFRANSIFHSHVPTSTTADVWKSQNPDLYNNLSSANVTQDADGYDRWKESYQHFCVTGSKITAVFEPTSTGVPATMFVHLSGVQGAVQTNTTSAVMNGLPYCNRASLASSASFAYTQAGSSLSMNYSARKFEGVKDPEDNSNLRGRLANANLNPPTTGATPGEQSFYYVAFAPVDPSTVGTMAKGVLRIKVEYITQLKEPTDSNNVQVITTGTANGNVHGADM